jgi:hypothetical protein
VLARQAPALEGAGHATSIEQTLRAAGRACEPEQAPTMFTKPLLLSIATALGITSGAAPDSKDRPAKPPGCESGQHFCCTSIDKLTGEGCVTISRENINTCDKVLYCDGTWMKSDGKVVCK